MNIYELQQRAAVLAEKNQTASVTPREIGQLNADILAYVANLEISSQTLGIRKVYTSLDALNADTTPTANDKPIKEGQLVCIYNPDSPTQAENGNIYARQASSWVLLGNIAAQLQDTRVINEETTARKQADTQLQSSIENTQKALNKEREARITDTRNLTQAIADVRPKDVVRKVRVSRGNASSEVLPDSEGVVSVVIPDIVLADNVEEGNTGAVSSAAVAAKFKEQTSKYGTAVRLQQSGEDADKKYSIELLDENGEVLSSTEQFSGAGGGGGSVGGNRIVLTRLSPNQTIKEGQAVKLRYSYDQVDTATNASTGNAARAIVTIIHGATTHTYEQTIAAGATIDIDATAHVALGVNSIKVRVLVDEQVSSIAWSINIVQLTLTSSYNIATATPKGDVAVVPYTLSGSGNKTLRCYLDGEDIEDRTISASQANGNFRIDTSSLAHGAHSVQLVAAIEEQQIKSNSIYFDLIITEANRTEPIIAFRPLRGGAIIPFGERPGLSAEQYENFAIDYAVYTPNSATAKVSIYENEQQTATLNVPFTPQRYESRAVSAGLLLGKIVSGATQYIYKVNITPSSLSLQEATDNRVLYLSARGKSNADAQKESWNNKATLHNFKFGGDGYINGALHHTDDARTIIHYKPLERVGHADSSFAIIFKYKVTEVTAEDVPLISCLDNGVGFTITATEARMTTAGQSSVSMKMAAGNVYEVAFVSFPTAGENSSDYERLNSSMLYLYINGIMSGAVQRGVSDGVYQTTPQEITIGSNGASLDLYHIKVYNSYLSDTQVLDTYIAGLDDVAELTTAYNRNAIIDSNGNVNVERMPDNMRYLIITGAAENGEPTVLQAAVNNNKKQKYDVEEILCVKRSDPSRNFVLKGGCISLQGTSSLAYPIKNYRIYMKNAQKKEGELTLGCNEQGVGGAVQAKAKYSFKAKAAAVNCFCLKADYAESSSSHNTGVARLVDHVLKEAGLLTPPQKYASKEYKKDIRTTIDGEPCYLFYRATKNDTPILLGKFNFNNDKSTEEVFGFRDIEGYDNSATECWEFLNNDYPMGSFLDDDFTANKWKKVFEARYPDKHEDTTQLARVVKWVKSTANNGAKFKRELADYFDVDYLCAYYIFTDILGAVDQRVKNMMIAFWNDPKRNKTLAYMIFYDNDTILGVRNDGRLKYGWDIDENTRDEELGTYAYMGHESVLWRNLREQFAEELKAAYVRIRGKMSNETIFKFLDDEQAAKFCERIYNLDGLNKYVSPKTKGVRVVANGAVQMQKYSYLEAMQGSRQAHRHWWLINRLGLFDARYSTGTFTATDLTFKGISGAGATIKATASRDFYFEFRREGQTMVHQLVRKGEEFSYTYDQAANVGTIFHLLGGAWASKIDLSGWGGFTDLNIPTLPVCQELVLGAEDSSYALTELAIGAKLPMLRKLVLRNYTHLATLDLSQCTRLEEIYARGCTALSSITFAEGAPLSRLYLPTNYKTLKLHSLSKLTRENISFENIASLTAINIENCMQIDGLAFVQEMLASPRCELRNIRVDVNRSGDGSELKQLYDLGIGGIDAQGNSISNHCTLLGTYRLTRYMEEEQLVRYQEYFNTLTLKQPEFTMIEFDDNVADPANITNTDNNTGYRHGNTYVPNGHITAILKQRHRVLMKIKSPKQAVIAQLDDANSNRFADGTAATLDGTQGDWMVYEPHYWYKGINDILNGKKYACFSSQAECPSSFTDYVEYSLEQLKEREPLIENKIVNRTKEGVIKSSITNQQGYNLLKVAIPQGYAKVRFPACRLDNDVCTAFVDAKEMVIKKVAPILVRDIFENGMYLIADIPQGATHLWLTLAKDAPFDCVMFTNATRPEDYEPHWVEHDPCLMSVVRASLDGSVFQSKAKTMYAETLSYDGTMVAVDSQNGMMVADYEMYKDFTNLAYAHYGRRNTRSSFGIVRNNTTETGKTSSLGMSDTLAHPSDKATSIKQPDAFGEMQYSFFPTSNTLGYENLFATRGYHGVMLGGAKGKLAKRLVEVTTPQGNKRLTLMWQGWKFFAATSHQRYMDILPIGGFSGSDTTYYTALSRISEQPTYTVIRATSYDLAASDFGAFECNIDSARPDSSIRLGYRGAIEWAVSSEEFKKINNIRQ